VDVIAVLNSKGRDFDFGMETDYAGSSVADTAAGSVSTPQPLIFMLCHLIRGTLLVAQLVEALCYKPEGGGFDSR
jgi:hypothetical protein